MADPDNALPMIDVTPSAPRLTDTMRGPVIVGLIIVIGFFGIAGGWAALSPLDGAVVGDGVVTVDGNRKTVQHLEGGIVRDILVHDGDQVKVGDILMHLDDRRLRSQVEIVSQQLVIARATEARLTAELGGAQAIAFPPDLVASSEDYVRRALLSQTQAFDARRTALLGNQSVLQHRIDDLQQQIEGKQQRQTALEAQLKSIADEQESLSGLIDQKLTTRTRTLDLERAAASVDADVSDNLAAIASAHQQIAETRQQSIQLVNDQRAQITGDLGDAEAKVLDLTPQLDAASATLARAVVYSPYEGRVVGMKVFSTGAVIPPGGAILDIVPDQTELVVTTKLNVQDIADVSPGASAELHFTSTKRMYVPMMRGKVQTISADRLTDDRTGLAYYQAQVVVDPQEVKQSTDIALYPGMPAQVMIVTKQRSALEYLLGPLFASLDGSFRQN